jgi:hypothetical protein
MRTCQNCGREHEGRLVEEFKDGDNKPIQIVVCNEARYEESAWGQATVDME